MYSKSSRKWYWLIFRYLFIAVMLIWLMLPILWVFLTSIKHPKDAIAIPPKLIFKPTLVHYRGVFLRFNFGRHLWNSLSVGLLSTTMALLLGSFAAYSLSRFRTRRRGLLLALALLVRMIPGIVIILPLFQMFRFVRLLGTKWTVVLAHCTFLLPLTIWMMWGFFQDIPVEIEESAMIDGCSRLRALFRIAVPLAAPGLAACFIINLIMSWNEFMFALILTSGQNRTLPALVVGFIEFMGVDFGKLTAASFLIMLPMMVFGLFVQRHFTRGLTGGIH